MDSSNNFEIISIDVFAERMGIGRTLAFDWKKSGFLQEGEHYLKKGKKLLFMWSQDIVADIFKGNKKNTPVIDTDVHSRTEVNKGKNSPKVNLDYQCKGKHGKPKRSIAKH